MKGITQRWLFQTIDGKTFFVGIARRPDRLYANLPSALKFYEGDFYGREITDCKGSMGEIIEQMTSDEVVFFSDVVWQRLNFDLGRPKNILKGYTLRDRDQEVLLRSDEIRFVFSKQEDYFT